VSSQCESWMSNEVDEVLHLTFKLPIAFLAFIGGNSVQEESWEFGVSRKT
jgi:hydroxymethylglutaryl-CoA reductase